MSLGSGVVVCCWCHWESRPQKGGGIAQAWATWPEGASAPIGTVMCRGHGVPEMNHSSFARFFKFFKLVQFSFVQFHVHYAMTSGFASDSDKFKIIKTLRRAQKYRDTGPYKNFDFLYNPLVPEFFFAISAKNQLYSASHPTIFSLI